ncbi:ribosomal protein S5, partial [Anncaliia algerae PRA109]
MEVKQEKVPQSTPRVPRESKEKEWIPTTDLGILVKTNKVNMEDISRFSLRVKEVGIIEHLFKNKLSEVVLKIKSVQKQTKAGQRTRMKAVVVVGDNENYVGLGTKTAKEAAVAIRGAIEQAKLNLRPIKLGYWGSKYGAPHTVTCKSTGRSGSVLIRLIPAPKGSGIVAGSVPKKICTLA